MEKLGTHIIADFSNCRKALIDDIINVKYALHTVVYKLGMTEIGEIFHEFNPHGITGIIAIAESHISVHSWYDEAYLALDIFTCGSIDVEKLKDACDFLATRFGAKNVEVKIIDRGRVIEEGGE